MSSQNVILITVDSVRADYCGFLNSALDTTPYLSELAEDGVVYENAIAPGPRTLSSVPVSHTNSPLPVSDKDLTDYQNRVDRIRTHLSQNETLARYFQKEGYSTLAFTTNPWTSQVTNFDTGFDEFEEFENQDQSAVENLFSGTSFEVPAKFLDQWSNNKVWFSQWPTYYDQIISSIKDKEEPFFLWVFLLDTHNPYFPDREDRKESFTPSMYLNMLRGNSAFNQTAGMTTHRESLQESTLQVLKRAYRDCIRSVDRFVETLLSDLDSADPALLFHSDHGEAFGEHGTYGHQPRLYEENIRVPLLLHNVGATDRISDPVSLESILEMLRSIESNEFDPTRWSREYVFSRTERSDRVAVRGKSWKYIRDPEGDELYDLNLDPHERRSIASAQGDVRENMEKVLRERLEAVPDSAIQTGDSVDNETNVKDRLESLGYVS